MEIGDQQGVPTELKSDSWINESQPEGQGHFVDIGALGTSKDKGHLRGTRTCEGTTSRDVPQSRCGVNFADEISVSWEVCNTPYLS